MSPRRRARIRVPWAWAVVYEPLAAAACRSRDPDLFYDEGHYTEAQSICAGCPVMTQCELVVDRLEDLSTDSTRVFGVWGGETPIERIRRRATVGPA